MNCGERYKDTMDHRSYTHKIEFEIQARKKLQARTGFKPMTLRYQWKYQCMQCSTSNQAIWELVTL